MKFVGIYDSADASCAQRFASKERDDLMFPPQVALQCPVHKKDHNWRLTKTFQYETDKQKATMTQWLKERSIETNILVL